MVVGQTPITTAVLICRSITRTAGQIELRPAALARRRQIGTVAVGEHGYEIQTAPGLGAPAQGLRSRQRLRSVMHLDRKHRPLPVDADGDRPPRGVAHGVGDQLASSQLDSGQCLRVEPYAPGADLGHDAVSCLLGGGCRSGDGERELVVRCHERASWAT
ncbi:hypothetical protein ACS04_21580 [Streptomyces roseus]|uniref:Uncharacterized protein n=1 Tax=Streptomyces roseus TaxID=66430 RepID=A0A0J6XIE0_9ACTN|nr:hypothetical protein ACS04_21580 [Streptomyces roseus]